MDTRNFEKVNYPFMVTLLQMAGFIRPDGSVKEVGSVHVALPDGNGRLFLGFEKNKQKYDFFGGTNDHDSHHHGGDVTSSVLATLCNELLEELCVVFNEPLSQIAIGALRCRTNGLLIVCRALEIPSAFLTSVMQRRVYSSGLPPSYREMSACGWVTVSDIHDGIPVTSYVREQIDAVLRMYDEEMEKGYAARGNFFKIQFTIKYDQADV